MFVYVAKRYYANYGCDLFEIIGIYATECAAKISCENDRNKSESELYISGYDIEKHEVLES
jgi:hypothetical protein